MDAGAEHEVPPPAAMMGLITGYWVSQAVGVVALLGVADQLGEGPRSSDELARAVGADPQALYRVLRLLASLGVFAEVAPRLLRADPARRDVALGRARLGAQLRDHGDRARALAALGAAARERPVRPADGARGARDGAVRLVRAEPRGGGLLQRGDGQPVGPGRERARAGLRLLRGADGGGCRGRARGPAGRGPAG